MASKILDLDEIVKTWAWNTFLKVRGKKHKKLQQEDVKMEVHWFRVRVTVIPSSLQYWDQHSDDVPTSSASTEKAKGSFPAGTRSTEAMCNIAINKGFTMGTSQKLKLGVPQEVAKATRAFGDEITLNSPMQQTQFKNEHLATKTGAKGASETRDRKFDAKFKVMVKIEGVVPVAVSQVKTNSFLMSIEGCISQIMSEMADTPDKSVVIDNGTVTVETEGTCHYRFEVDSP